MPQRTLPLLLLAAATVTALTACTGDNGADAPPPAAASSFSVELSREPTPTTTPPPTTIPRYAPPAATTPAAEPDAADTTARRTPAGVICDLVSSDATGQTLPVAVLTGAVDCAVAVPVADRYLNDIDLYIEGQGRRATIDGWTCLWPYVEGRSHADSYLSCTDPTGAGSIRIGD